MEYCKDSLSLHKEILAFWNHDFQGWVGRCQNCHMTWTAWICSQAICNVEELKGTSQVSHVVGMGNPLKGLEIRR